MKDLFREFDFTKVGYYQSILEAQGVQTFIRNQDVSSLIGEASIMPDLWPTLCVVNDEDYSRAMEMIRETSLSDAIKSEREVTCPSCHEENPGNFEVCWACSGSLGR